MRFLFDPEKLHAIAREAAGPPIHEALPKIVEALERTWPGAVTKRPEWMLAIYGGTTATMTILHASLSEYILVYGSPLGTNGFSGRYLFDCYDWMLRGEMRTYRDDDSLRAETYGPGDGAFLPHLRAKGYSITPDSWMLEYGRGFIPSGLPFALAGPLHASPDWPTLGRTLRIYGTQVVGNLLKGKI